MSLNNTPVVVELDINKRWEEGLEHHQKSLEIFAALCYIDFNIGGDYFWWKSGGDGDNGEHFMYELDIYFECKDAGIDPFTYIPKLKSS